MKRIITATIFAFALILSVGKTLAQSPAILVNVPFNFNVGDKQLPAGTYTISMPSTGVLDIVSRDRHIEMWSIGVPDYRGPEHDGELVFTRYGNQYFLHEILCKFASMNVNLPATRSEKRVRTQEAMVENAKQILLAEK